MTKMTYWISLIIGLLCYISPLQAEEKPKLASVQIQLNEKAVRLASLGLGREESLSIDFDLLGKVQPMLAYRLIHCKSDGQASDLSDYEALEQSLGRYLTGESSLATYLPYQHYRLTLPNSQVRFKLSGIYRLEVYREDNEEIMLSMPIYVHEGLGEVQAKQLSAFESYCGSEHQGIALSYTLPNNNPTLRLQEPLIITLQNGSNTLPPIRSEHSDGLQQNSHHYTAHNAPCFPAGNRYIPLEHRQKFTAGIGIVSWEQEEGVPLIITAQEDYRTTPLLRQEQTQQGIQVVGGLYADNKLDTQGEYHLVRFSLIAPEGLDIYLEGAAFDYLPKAEKRLIYDPLRERYTLTIPLKQGYQEYRYIAFDKAGKLFPLEGNYYATQNYYTHLVFLPDFRSERLLLVAGAN